MQEQTSLFSTKIARNIALFVIFALGIAIRLYDLTDLPLEFHSTRQLLSALKARGMYYETRTDVSSEERAFAIQQWKFRASVEPEFFERLVAWTYQFTGEQVWIARIYSFAFWIIGGVFLYLLARRLTSDDGAIATTAVYLFLPYAIIASRSFQPDPLMTMLIIIFLWAIWEWSHNSRWIFVILAGLFGGFAIFIKFPAVFFIVGGGLGAVLSRGSIKEALKNPQVYVMALLGILPGAAYLIYGIFIAGYLGQQFSGRFIPTLFLSPSYYLGWMNMLNLVMGGLVLMLALLGFLFFDEKKRRFLLGLWIGYATFGLYFNYHISTHDYYSLPLIPIAALSLAPLAEFFFAKLAELTSTKLLRFSAFLFLGFGLIAVIWNTRNQLNAVDYRPEAAMWAEISHVTDGYNLAGLTQDYGARVAYFGWRTITSWPAYGDLLYSTERGGSRDLEEQFAEITAKKDLFLVTDFNDLARQPLLKAKLESYPIFADGDGYVVYNLMQD
ncbi:MAG: glycosyltransferase family 39 protein [Anaerolineales bacterium]|nr:glycosyltransferase family 39 protein [Anaerolineales bacterium]